MPHIIFIGAGPIGLIAAIQLKQMCEDKEILMFEKYEEPLRNHAMYVDHRSFKNMNRSNGFGELLDSISTKVIISDLEKKLRAYALAIGIKIHYETIKSFDELQKAYPQTQYFVGSGGLKGIVHPQLFDNEKQINEPIRHAVEVKYKAVGTTRALNKLTETSGILSYTNHLVSEYVGHLKDELTPVSLRIFIDESTYDAMKEATFKNPYTLEDKDKIPEQLYKTIEVYLSGRKHIANEQIESNSLKISTITLSLYASKYFCRQVNGKTIFTIGEESFACPFYRSFNDNASSIPFFTTAMKAIFEEKLIESIKLPKSSFFSVSMNQQTPLDYYQKKVQKLVNKEIGTIHRLNFGIKMIETSVASSQFTPQFSGAKLNLKQGGRMFLEERKNENKEVGNPSSGCTLC